MMPSEENPPRLMKWTSANRRETVDRAEIPELSLVMPCYNEAEVLRNTVLRLVQVFEDGGVNLELILVDNGSRTQPGPSSTT